MSFYVRPEIEAIIEDFENFNSNSANNKIKILKRSPDFKKLSLQELIVFKFYYIRFKSGIENFDKLEEEYHELEAKLIDKKKSDIQSRFIFQLLINFFLIKRNKDQEDIIKNINENIELISKMFSKNFRLNHLIIKFKLYFYLDTADYFFSISDLKTCFDYLELMINLSKEYKIDYFIYSAYKRYINYAIRNNHLITFEKIAKNYIDYYNDSGNLLYEALSYHIVSKPLYAIGEIKKGLTYKKKALKIAKKMSLTSEGELMWIEDIYNSLGIYYQVLGKYEKSIQYYKEGLQFTNDKAGIITANLSELYFDLGEFDEAIRYRKISLERQLKNPGNHYLLAESYYQLVDLYLKLENVSVAENNFQHLKDIITNDHSNYLVKLRNEARYKTANAKLLITKKSSKSTYDAQVLLQSVVNSDNIDSEIIIDALFPLLNVLIQEYKFYQNEEIFDQIKVLFNRLQLISENFKNLDMKIESLILQSRFEMVLGNYENFEQLLFRARDLAMTYDLPNYSNWITEELSKFKSEMQKWQNVLVENTSLKKRLEEVELERYVNDVKKMLKIEIKEN